MKRILGIILSAILIFSLAGCSGSKKNTLKVGATPVPHEEILEQIKPLLKEKGIELEIVPFTDYVIPNKALAEKELDANFFQHLPYLESFSRDNNLELSSVASIHVEPMGFYSQKIKDLSELKDGDIVAIPNDPTNGGRSLLLLQKNNIIKLKDGVGLEATPKDIAENPKNLKFEELDAALLSKKLDEVAGAIINTNFALEAGLNPLNDAIVIEDKDSPYANIVVVRKGDENREDIKALVEVLTSEDVKKFIEEKYKGAIIPAF